MTEQTIAAQEHDSEPEDGKSGLNGWLELFFGMRITGIYKAEYGNAKYLELENGDGALKISAITSDWCAVDRVQIEPLDDVTWADEKKEQGF